METQNENPKKISFIPVLLVLLVLGAYFYFSYSKNAQSTTSSTAEATNQPMPKKQAPPVETPVETSEETSMAQNEVKVTIEGSNFSFSPNVINAKVGDKVIVEFKNMDGFHDFKVDEFNAKTKILKTGESETIEFTVDKSGTFEFYCSVGEHRKMGMVGQLIVK